jgi:hypothetical protein
MISPSGNQLDPNGQYGLNINNLSNSNNNVNTIVDFSVGSMPANYGYDESFSKDDLNDESSEDAMQNKPRIMIMGLRR